LQKKANKNIIEPFSVRIKKVRTFLQFFKPGLEYDIVPLNDVLGPTGWDPDIQALVASKETLDGAESSMFFFQNVL
jgi:pantetheine-phosphate adenylyltransferase